MGVSVVRGLVIFLLCSLSVACTTIGEKEEINESGYSNEPLPLLFEKDELCVFYDDELLYLYFPTHGSYQTVLYDKRNGLYSIFTLKDKKTYRQLKYENIVKEFKCTDYKVDLSDILDVSDEINQYYVVSDNIRLLFDNAAEDIESFKKEISPYPSFVGYYHSIKAAVLLESVDLADLDDYYLGDFKYYYKNLSPSEADELINPVLAKIAEEQAEKERKEREEKLMIERFKMEQRIAQERWDNRLSANYGIGDKVCTYDNNSFGYIEGLNASKMKVHVVGQANGKNGFFFSGRKGGFNYKPVEAIRWFNRSELAPCYFD